MSVDDDNEVETLDTKKRKLQDQEVVAEESDTVTLSVYDFVQLQNNQMRYIENSMKLYRHLLEDKDENKGDHKVYFNVADCFHDQLSEYAWKSKILIEKNLSDKPKARSQYALAIRRFNEVLLDCIGQKLHWKDEDE